MDRAHDVQKASIRGDGLLWAEDVTVNTLLTVATANIGTLQVTTGGQTIQAGDLNVRSCMWVALVAVDRLSATGALRLQIKAGALVVEDATSTLTNSRGSAETAIIHNSNTVDFTGSVLKVTSFEAANSE